MSEAPIEGIEKEIEAPAPETEEVKEETVTAPEPVEEEPKEADPPAPKSRSNRSTAQKVAFEKANTVLREKRRARAIERKERIEREKAEKAEKLKRSAPISTNTVHSAEEAQPLLDLLHPFLELTRVQQAEIEELRARRNKRRRTNKSPYSSDSEVEKVTRNVSGPPKRAPDTIPIQKPREVPQRPAAPPPPTAQEIRNRQLANFMNNLGY